MRPLLLSLLLLTGCSDDRPPAPTSGESEQLNAAEDLLNAEAAHADGPKDRSPGPSH